MERFTLKIFNKPKSSVRNVCRLCGMDNPNKVFILRDDDVFCEDDVPLSTKIQVCCGIEVTKKDRMPQKICPLCSDKINDFYEFREMCTATNVQTRDLLGLPKEKPKPKLQPPPFLAPLSKATQNHIERQDTPSRTILQPPIISESKTMRDTTPQRRPVGRPTRGQKVAKKKTTGKVIKNTRGAKGMNTRKKEQLTRAAKLVNLKQEPKDPPPPPPPKPTPVVDIKPLLKPAVVKLTNILPIPPSPSLSQPKPGPASKTKPNKRVQFAPPLPVEEKRPSLEELEKPRPKKARVEKPPKPPVQIKCQICTESVDKSCYSRHMMKIHTPKTFEYGCSPCGVPFETLKDYRDHQNWHRDDKIPFRCFKCLRVFEKLASYIVHSQKFCTGNHNFTNTVPNINCTMCGMEFVTFNLYNWHECFIKSNTNCPKCDRFIQRKDRLFKHIFVCRGKGTTGISSPEVPEDVNSGEMEKLGTLVPKVKPLKIKIHKRTFSTVAGGSRVETVIKTEPDSTLEIEESQVNIEGASLHTSYEDIQPPKAKPKSPKSPKKKMTLKNPYARLAKRIKQEPKEPTEVAQQVPRTPQQASKSLVRVKQEPVDSGYEKIVRIAAKNIKKERIDPTEEPPQEENQAEMETETPQEEDETPPLEEEPPQADNQSEEEEEAEPERPPPPPPLPRGVRIKQEKPDHVIVKPERIDPAYDKHLPPKPPAKVQKVAKKRVFKIPTALILKLQQEKKQQEKEAQPETQSNHEEQQTDTVGQAQVNDEQPEQPEAPQEAPEVPEVAPEAPEAAPEAEPAPQTPQATVPVITGVMSIEKSAFRAPFVPVRIKTERMSPTRTLHRDENTAQEENGVNGSLAHEEDKDAEEEIAADEEAATDATENEKNTEVAEEETTLEVPKEIPEQNAAEPEKPAEPEENLPVSISTNDQNGVSHEIPMSIEESEATVASQAEQNV